MLIRVCKIHEIRRKEGQHMDATTVIRLIAGMLAVIVLGVVIYRRRSAKSA